jgi:hypothetical protein
VRTPVDLPACAVKMRRKTVKPEPDEVQQELHKVFAKRKRKQLVLVPEEDRPSRPGDSISYSAQVAKLEFRGGKLTPQLEKLMTKDNAHTETLLAEVKAELKDERVRKQTKKKRKGKTKQLAQGKQRKRAKRKRKGGWEGGTEQLSVDKDGDEDGDGDEDEDEDEAAVDVDSDDEADALGDINFIFKADMKAALAFSLQEPPRSRAQRAGSRRR